MSVVAYILIFGLMGCLMLSVIYGLYWAVRRGQFSNFRARRRLDLRRGRAAGIPHRRVSR